MRKKLELSSDDGDTGSKKCKGCYGYGSAHGAVWRSLHLATVWSQAVDFVLVRLAGTSLKSPWTCFRI
jgi:hypothetical protein